VTSPNEPGRTGPGDTPNGNGSAERSADTQRKWNGPGPAQAQQRQSDGPKQRPAGRPSAGPSAEARLNRFISGTAAQVPDTDARNESQQNDAYPSELPDLSGPIPRAGQRKSAADESVDLPTSRVRTHVSSRPRGPVRASMQIRRIDPWSTLKVSLVLSVALFFVWMIAVAFLYLVLGGMGVWSKLNSNVGDLLNNTSGSAELVSAGTIFGGAVLIGLVNIVLLTAAATIGAFIYNLTTDLIGGVEVTLADRD
jgi:hypothetical protein